MIFDALDLDQVYRVAVIQPAEPSAAASREKLPLSPVEIEALQGRLGEYLAYTKKRERKVFQVSRQAEKEFRSLEMQIRRGGLRIVTKSDRVSLNATIEALERVLPSGKKVVDEQFLLLQNYAVSSGPIGKAIYKEEKKILDHLTKFYNSQIDHYYFMLSVRARDEQSEPEFVAYSATDIDRLFA